MVYIDFDQFDDELQRMLELMEEGKIALNDDVLKIPIKSLHLRRAVLVEKGTTVRQCINMLLARNFGCLLVTENNKISGIFTERDVLIKIADQDLDLDSAVIDDFMSSNPVCVKMKDSLANAIAKMSGGYRHIAIVDEKNYPLAVLSTKDIIGYLVEFFPNDVLNLPPHPIRIGTRDRYGA